MLVESFVNSAPNGVRYLRVGGRRRRYFDGTSFKPRELPKNAATPTRRVHAVLARFWIGKDNIICCFFSKQPKGLCEHTPTSAETQVDQVEMRRKTIRFHVGY